MKYDSHGGRGATDNYHGLGWQAKYGDEGFGAAGKYPKGYAPKMYPTPMTGGTESGGGSSSQLKYPLLEALVEDARRRNGEDVPRRRVVDAEDEPLPVPTDGVTANSEGVRRRSYPTPTAQDSDKRRSKRPPPSVKFTATGLPEADRPSGSGKQLTLVQSAHIVDAQKPRFWPTPVKHEDRAAKYRLDTSYRHFQEGRQTHLAQAVRDERMQPRKSLPTPTSQNGLRGGGQGAAAEHHPGKWQHPGHPEYGELNPDWVEWIMGWPLGWTSPDPIAAHAVANWQGMTYASHASQEGAGLWWQSDPSDEPEAGVPKTVAAGDKPAEEVRVGRIAALGNGQVPAVVAAVWTHLWNLEVPEGEGD